MHVLAAAAAHPGGAFLAFGFVVLFVGAYARDRVRAPFIDCWCRGGRVRSSWREGAWGEHAACGGKGRRRRVL